MYNNIPSDSLKGYIKNDGTLAIHYIQMIYLVIKDNGFSVKNGDFLFRSPSLLMFSDFCSASYLLFFHSIFFSLCVSERETETERERQGERERKRERVSVCVCVIYSNAFFRSFVDFWLLKVSILLSRFCSISNICHIFSSLSFRQNEYLWKFRSVRKGQKLKCIIYIYIYIYIYI